jgi:alkylation response protein AidB-like acyl-CoA dehydrogenase
MMDFSLAESQQAVAGLAAQVLAGADPWKELAQAGLLDVSPPDGLGVLDAAVLLTQIGRNAPPDSLKALATLMTGALPVARWGSEDLQRALLPGVASGELQLTAALREPSNPAPTPPATAVTNATITGTKVGVPYAAEAHRILIPARLTPAPALSPAPAPPLSPAPAPPPSSMIVGSSGQIASETAHDHGVAVVDPSAEGVTLTRTPSSSGQPEYTVRLDGAPVAGVLGGPECVRDLYQLAVAGACALADGAVAGALALTRDHVATREQFGRPLAAFQAVSQQIAEVYIASRTMHLAALAGCWRLAEGLDAAADLDVAGYWCAEQAPRAVRICHHLHGGLGMDVSYPLHQFSSLVADLARFLGGADYRLDLCSST